MKLSKKIIAALMITTVFSSNYYTYADQLHNKVVKINDDSSLEALCKSDTNEKKFQKLSCNNIIAVYHNDDNYN